MTNKHTVSVSVKSEYLASRSEPANKRFAFAYHITIANNSDEMVQLISRFWQITDGNNDEQEVTGVGVIGEQPEIAPGSSYSYSSGVVLETPVGTMQGSYQMINSEGEFDAPIPPFMLSVPGALH